MKKLFCVLISIFFLLPTFASAHTELVSSDPEPGQVVTEDKTEIVLTFGGSIESLSTMNLVMDGQDVAFDHVKTEDKQLLGTLSVPLDNGSYLINWEIVGADGHLITGEIPFTVQIDKKDEQNIKTTDPVTTEKGEKQEQKQKQKQEQKQENVSKQDNSSLKIIITIGVIIILGIGLFLLFGRKK